MKGKRQLFWSHGLKDRVGLEEVSDEDSSLGGDDLDMLGRLALTIGISSVPSVCMRVCSMLLRLAAGIASWPT